MADAAHSDEIWKEIPAWEGLYQASSMGRVRSIPRTKMHKSKRGKWFEQPLKGRVLRPGRQEKGYLVVALSDARNGRKPRTFRVHRLVALAFLPNPEGKPEVAHNDGVRSNNLVTNLRWATREENLADVRLHKEQATRLG